MKEILKKYIQFAVDNWYKPKIYDDNENYNWEIKDQLNYSKIKEINLLWYYFSCYSYNSWWAEKPLLNVITSKEFIEAVVNWWPFDTCELEDLVWREECGLTLKSAFQKRIDRITFFQAIAIREWKLEEFIKNLINSL